MALLSTFLTMQDYVLQRAGMGSERRALSKQWVNLAHLDMCEAYDWPELLTEGVVNTVASITAGTVDVTDGDATVTEDAGTPDWSSPDVTGRKFALGSSMPPFDIDSVTDADNLELTVTWPFDTATAQSYIIYQDVYSLASTVDKVYGHRVTLHDNSGRTLGPITHDRSITSWRLPTGEGRPHYFWFIGRDSSGNKQIQIGPRVPDDVYVIRYWYRAKHIDMTLDDDTPQLEPSLLEAVCEGALIRAYQMPEFADTDKAERQEARYNRMLAKKIKDRRQRSPRGVQPGAFGTNVGRRGLPFTTPVSAD